MTERYEGRAILELIELGDGSRILLLNPDEDRSPVFENLLSISSTGDVLWKARLPTPLDAFVKIERGRLGVEATTWSGYRLVIDYRSGNELSREFVK